MRKKTERDIPISWTTHVRMATGGGLILSADRSHKGLDDIPMKYLESMCKLRPVARSMLGPEEGIRKCGLRRRRRSGLTL
jgi:hypothetical protein